MWVIGVSNYLLNRSWNRSISKVVSYKTHLVAFIRLTGTLKMIQFHMIKGKMYLILVGATIAVLLFSRFWIPLRILHSSRCSFVLLHSSRCSFVLLHFSRCSFVLLHSSRCSFVLLHSYRASFFSVTNLSSACLCYNVTLCYLKGDLDVSEEYF
jgi:hypothetical protein